MLFTVYVFFSVLPDSFTSLYGHTSLIPTNACYYILYSSSCQGGIISIVNESSLLLVSDDETSLLDRLKLKPAEDFDPVPPQLLRKYIGYARKYVHPTLSKEAADVLQVHVY